MRFDMPSESHPVAHVERGVEIVVPLRWDQPWAEQASAVQAYRSYLKQLSRLADVTIVDGSRPPILEAHREAWGRYARMLRPQGQGVNGKVLGAVTGIQAARHELVVLADDDVRYDAASLEHVVGALAEADVVRPQNVYTTWPWQAREDFGRSLIARALWGDWPGTFGLRASAVRRMGGWSADVLFENLQMVRTARHFGLRVVDAPSVVVDREPPTVERFWSQRVRQAYDDFAQPARLTAELLLLPTVLTAAMRRPPLLLGGALVCVVLGEVGRRRYGRLPVPRTAALWCPVWAAERAVCVWLAVGTRLRGGVRYNGIRVRDASLPVASVPVAPPAAVSVDASGSRPTS
jgi:Glycosyl transferase family 21